MENPLLTEAGLPPCKHIEVGHVEPAIGYYSYKWAEVLAADAFSKFQEGGVFDAGTGEGFMQIFPEQGGTREPMEMFVQFRGREPRIASLLRRWGLAA